MKQKLNVILGAACAVGSAALGITWLYRGLFGAGGSYAVPAGTVWLIPAAIWAARTVREFRKTSKEITDKTNYV